MNRLQAACRRALCLPIRAYQHTLSPWIGRSCRFTPSCSNYTMQAILTHGCIKGILLGAWRIARCNPWANGATTRCRPRGGGKALPGTWSLPGSLKSGIGDRISASCDASHCGRCVLR